MSLTIDVKMTKISGIAIVGTPPESEIGLISSSNVSIKK
jgi:hypothetical protein